LEDYQELENMMPQCRLILLLLIAGSFLAAGCSSVRRGDPISGPLDRSDAKTERGKLVFQRHCYQCHPGGEGGLGPGLNDKPAPVWLMKTQVRLGLGAMPGFGNDQISDEALHDLMSYVVALRKDK
jgi:mono/diheme cytochrome c family protein